MHPIAHLWLVLLIVGGSFILIAIREAVKYWNVSKKGAVIGARVVSTAHVKLFGVFSTYSPMVEFDMNGQRQTVNCYGSLKPRYKNGETVKIQHYVDPKNVRRMSIVGDKSTYIIPTIFGAAGIVLFALGISMLPF